MALWSLCVTVPQEEFFNTQIRFISRQQLTSYLHLLQGLHVDTAALAILYKGQVEGIHQDDSPQAWGVVTLHIVQQHLSFLCLVTDDCGDFG